MTIWNFMFGWLGARMPAKRVHWLPLAACLALAPLPAWAGDDTPDAELLEFLASWMDDEGSFVDPVQLEEVPLPEKKPAPDDSEKPGQGNGKDGKNGEGRD
jgi:hypothetical protein